MIINHNLPAMNTDRQLGINNFNTAKSLEKLSSGLRINRAGDDAAGLAISEKMRAQVRGLDQAGRNAQDGISLIQTAEGALNETHSILQRMRELAVQAASDTNVAGDRTAIQAEVIELRSEITRIADTTEFNKQKLLDGSFGSKVNTATATSTLLADAAFVSIDFNGGLKAGTWTLTAQADHSYILSDGAGTSFTSNIPTAGANGSIAFGDKLNINFNDTYAADAFDGLAVATTGTAATFQIGANQNQTMTLSIGDMDSTALGVNGIDLSTQTGASAAISTLDTAIATVSTTRANLGANQNRLEHTIANLGTSSENLTAAESRVRDVDMAKEMMAFQKNSILSQAATAMLAQANQQPQGVLQLLQ